MNNQRFFQHEQVAKGVIRVIGAGNELSYLITGSKKAALIDTGAGVGNIREYVEALTDLPLIVILTHFHIDHSAGSYYFDQVYLTPEDAKFLDLDFNDNLCNEVKKALIQFTKENNPQIELNLEDIVTPYNKKFEALSDGDIFDLGDISLEVLSCPGHTKGSVMILIKELRIIIFGDSCNPGVWVQLPESTSVEEFRDSLLRIKLREADYDRVLLSHGPREMNKEVLDEIIHVCQEVMDGRDDGIPYGYGGFHNAYQAKKVSEVDYSIRADGKVGNIIYKKIDVV